MNITIDPTSADIESNPISRPISNLTPPHQGNFK